MRNRISPMLGLSGCLSFEIAEMNRPTQTDFVPRIGTLCVALVLLGLTGASNAVILFRTDDPTANTTPPEGELVGSGLFALESFE